MDVKELEDFNESWNTEEKEVKSWTVHSAESILTWLSRSDVRLVLENGAWSCRFDKYSA